MSTAHPILPTAVAIKQAMDDIYEAAKEVFDISPWLDERGRLPFKNILPMLQAMPASGNARLGDIIDAMCETTIDDRYMVDIETLIDESITRIEDDAKILFRSNIDNVVDADEMKVNLYIPNCTYIGRNAFRRISNVSLWPNAIVTKADSFANLEEVGDNAFAYPGINEFEDARQFRSVLYFPKLRKIGHTAFRMATTGMTLSTEEGLWAGKRNIDITLSAIEEMENDSFVIAHTGWCAVRFPAKTKEEVKNMAGFPFGFRGEVYDGHLGGIQIFNTVMHCSDGKIYMRE